MLKGWSPQQVAAFASAVSAMKCTKLGGREGVGSFDETVEFCRDRGVDL
jgi:sugar/nucleoside kinase (ribokinase family)